VSPNRPQLSVNQRRALAEFLRARRARLTPVEVGLPAGSARRGGGLRREEVAVLAGVSVTWYTWLEQARPINPSPAVLRAISTTLRLSADETAHLFALAGPRSEAPTTEPPPALQDLVDSQHGSPAFLVDRRWDLMTWNSAAEAVWHFSAVPPGERNKAWLSFHPFVRDRLADWPAHARRVISELRGSSTALVDDARFAVVLARLMKDHPEAAHWWRAGEVRPRVGGHKVFDHPIAGRLVFDEVILRPALAPDLQLSIQIPAPGSDTAARLATLLAGPTT
jgi:transcriptional regulator with XRE-family HTH domain